MSLRHFFISKVFFKNILIAIAIITVILFTSLKTLDYFTLHSESFSLPDYTNLTINQLNDYNLNNEVEFIIIDSIFDDTKPKEAIISQDPFPNAKVKRGRKVYLTVVAKMPERVKMPNLINLSLRQSLSLLETYGLKVNNLSYVDDIAKNAVLQQLYNGGVILPDTLINKGSKIDLVLGRGTQNTQVKIPFLIGKKQAEIKKLLNLASLNIGQQYFLDSEDTSILRVYSTIPQSITQQYVEMGSYIDIYYRSEKTFDFLEYIKSLEADTLSTTDSTNINNDYFEDDIITE